MSPSIRVSFVAAFTLALAIPARVSAQDRPSAKSPGAAVLISLLGTLAPIAVDRPLGIYAGLVLGPNLGDLYGGDPGRAAKRTAIRAGVVGITTGAVVVVCGDGCSGFSEGGGDEAAAVLIVAGTVVTGILAVREIRGVGRRVQARND